MSYPDLYPDLYPGELVPVDVPAAISTHMEWYTLDASLRRNQVIEGYKSFIWTERYSAAGDFQIVTRSSFANRQLLAADTWIGKAGSDYVMKVQTISDDTAADGSRMMTVTGMSLEKLLDDRVAMGVLSDTTTVPNWVLTGTPGDVAREMFTQVCVAGVLNPLDTIPFYTPGTLLHAGNIAEPPGVITVTVTPDTLYNSLKSICDTYNLGFRLVRNGDLSEVYFEVYTGNNLTSEQSILPAVIFDPDMESLTQISQLTSTAVVKTVAYVLAANGFEVVYAPDADTTASGYGRRVLLINSSNSTVAGPDLTTALQQEGLIALSVQKPVYSFDGQLPQTLPYIYGTDYSLGDLVEERASDGYGNLMLVTEQIFSSDDTGERAYPTLTLFQTITPDSWLSEGSLEWSEVSSGDTWSTI